MGSSRLQAAQALLPPAARPAARELLGSLPRQLCLRPPADVAALPQRWKDAVCPLGAALSPLSAVASGGFAPWGVVVAAAAYNASLPWASTGSPARPSLSVTTMENGTELAELLDSTGGAATPVDKAGAREAMARAVATDPRYQAAHNQVGGRGRVLQVDCVRVCCGVPRCCGRGPRRFRLSGGWPACAAVPAGRTGLAAVTRARRALAPRQDSAFDWVAKMCAVVYAPGEPR
jgi:hypothetical protein